MVKTSESVKEQILTILKRLSCHSFLEIVTRGNAAITSALSIVPKDKKILIPNEGGWLHYRIAPKKLGLKADEVRCLDAKIDLADLKKKLATKQYGAFLYQNPGGYYAEQPMEEIYQLCQQNDCLVILDVSGSLGTTLCDGCYADLLVGSFGEWKLVEAHVGGFISTNQKKLWSKLKPNLELLTTAEDFVLILQKLNELPERIKFLQQLVKKVKTDLNQFSIVHSQDLSFVVVVKFKTETEKNQILAYCKKNDLHWTECPRYIRLNQPAISIEVKQRITS